MVGEARSTMAVPMTGAGVHALGEFVYLGVMGKAAGVDGGDST